MGARTLQRAPRWPQSSASRGPAARAEALDLHPHLVHLEPLRVLHRQRRSLEWQGRMREFYAFNYGPHYIWGATAAMVVNFAERLRT